VPNRIRRIAVMGLATLATACTTWQPQTSPVPEAVAADRDRNVRLLLHDGTSLELSEVAMVGDTLTGASISGADTTRWRLASERIARLEVRRANPAGTVALVVVGVGAVAVGASLIAFSTWDSQFGSSGYTRAAP
jgi:hypothetical protein